KDKNKNYMMSLNEYYDEETKTLILPNNFNEELEDLPSDIKIIIFDEDFWKCIYSKFNKKVDNLSNTITHIMFGSVFNQSVDKLPNTITHLTFGYWFNQSVDNLPNAIT